MGSVLDPSAPWQTKPDPKQVVGCRDGCHPDVQAKSDAGETFFEVWFAAAHREAPYVYETDVQHSRSLTKYFRHYHPEMSNTEIIPYEDLAIFLATTRQYRNFDPSEWERLIRHNMQGMREKPRLRWAFHVPVSDLEFLAQPDQTPNMIFMKDGTSHTPNDWWSKDTIA